MATILTADCSQAQMINHKPWLLKKQWHSLEITKYKSISNQQIKKSIQINDPAFIKRLAEKIEELPSDGPIMIKFGPSAKLIELLFEADGQIQIIRIIEKGFQTPSTGFNEPNNPELALYEEIHRLL